LKIIKYDGLNKYTIRRKFEMNVLGDSTCIINIFNTAIVVSSIVLLYIYTLFVQQFVHLIYKYTYVYCIAIAGMCMWVYQQVKYVVTCVH